MLKRQQIEEQKKREALAHKMFAKRLKNSDPSVDGDGNELLSPEEKRRQQDAKATHPLSR